MLAAVMGSPGAAQARIAEKGLKDRATVTRIVDVLEREGHLVRRNDERDRRAHRVDLSDHGRRTVEKIVPLVVDLNREMAEGLSKADVRSLVRLLRILEGNLSGSGERELPTADPPHRV